MTKTQKTAPSTGINMHVQIQPPKLRTSLFEITGTAPLVIHRFSTKVKEQMAKKMEEGKSAE